MKFPNGYSYSKDHEWVKVVGDYAYIGISDFAQHSLGEIVFVDLPEVDTEFSAGDTFGAVESVKAASDLYMPIGGKVLEINEALSAEPGLLNTDSYENWIVKIEMTDRAEVDALLEPIQYEQFVNTGK
ncbi:MAG: glycine cleavage system protein GcvH [Negativicutes bacterium]|jgi:glycine cleavage system H protein